MARKKSDPVEAFNALTAREKAKISGSYDRAIPQSESRALSSRERAQWERARRRGRPKVGMGSERLNVTLERQLLQKTDAYAKRHKLPRSKVIALGLQQLLRAM